MSWNHFAIFLLQETHYFLERTHQIFTPSNVSAARCRLLIISFLTRYNRPINDTKNKDLHSSSPCLTRLLYVLLMTSQAIGNDATVTRQLWCEHVTNDIGFNHGLPCYVKNMARGSQVDKNRGRRPRFLSWLRPEVTLHGKPWLKPIIACPLLGIKPSFSIKT